MNITEELRRELRVNPICEQVFWRQHFITPLLAARVRNISECGISFRLHDAKDVPRVGDQIQVKFLHQTLGMKPFVVKWIGHGKAGAAVGCALMDFSIIDGAQMAQLRCLKSGSRALAA
ncbi:MAG TPA: hypothetical protein VGQ99_16790 [Tepidisphaeraceae bacterium]|jgi:hypothetical protein|nr:hypothetical protein [Tepidisphaeraceae bacterium]